MDNKNTINYLSWFFIIIVVFLNAGIYTYLKSLSCSDGYCPTLYFSVAAFVSGIILGIYPFYKFSKKQIFVGILLIVFAIFLAYIIGEASWATKALTNPMNYPGFKRSGIPEHGILFSLFESSTYTYALFEALVITIGTLLGFGLRWIFNKLVPTYSNKL